MSSDQPNGCRPRHLTGRHDPDAARCSAGTGRSRRLVRQRGCSHNDKPGPPDQSAITADMSETPAYDPLNMERSQETAKAGEARRAMGSGSRRIVKDLPGNRHLYELSVTLSKDPVAGKQRRQLLAVGFNVL